MPEFAVRMHHVAIYVKLMRGERMSASAMTVRLDAEMKKQFEALCQQFGMSSNTPFNIFVNQVVRSRAIPFAITAETTHKYDVQQRAIAAFTSQREKAVKEETPDLTLDAINAEISEVRRLRKARKQGV